MTQRLVDGLSTSSSPAPPTDSVVPFVFAQTPAPSSTGISKTTDIDLSVDDLGDGIDYGTLLVQVDKGSGLETAFQNGLFVAPFNGPGSFVTPTGTAGFRVFIDPVSALPDYQTVQVRVFVRDLSPALNTLDTTYSFQTVDGAAPFLSNQTPAASATGIAVATNILLRVEDLHTGVVLGSIDIQVQQAAGPVVDAVINGVVVAPFNGAGSGVVANGNDYDVTLNPTTDLLSGSTITVFVQADDVAGNSLSTSYTFATVAEVSPPFLSHQVPAPSSGPAGNLDTLNIQFRINDTAIDPDSGVATASLQVEVQRGVGEPFENAILAGVFQTGFTGSITDLGGGLSYAIVINPTANLFDGDTTTVRVNVDDTKVPPNHLLVTYDFDIQDNDAVAPFVDDRDPAPSSTNNIETTGIIFDIHDAGTGVDLTTVNVTVAIDGGTPAQVVLAGVIQSGWSGSVTPLVDGYHFELAPNTSFGTSHTMTVEIDAFDLASIPNAMPTVTYSFSTEYLTPVCTLSQCRIVSLLGSIIQLDGRESKSPDGAPLTFEWKFIQVPIGSAFEAVLNDVNPVALKDLRPSSRSAVSFIPDKLGDYLIEMRVLNGAQPSDGCTALVEIGLSRAFCGGGQVPDANFMWSFLSNFWSLVEDRQYFTTIWSGQMQLVGAELIKLWSNDYNKSLDTIQSTVQRRWQRFSLHTDLSDRLQRLVLGNTAVGTAGATGEIGAPVVGTTKLLHTLLSSEDFTTIDVNYGAKGRIIDINGSAFTIERVYNTTVGITDHSVVVVDEDAVTDSQTGIPYRIPHLLHVPSFDLEEEGVRTGDTLVLEWTRGDSGLTAEMRVRVVAVDRERLGFELVQTALAPADPTLDYSLFEQLVQDLRIVPPTATELEIAAAANALIAFVPTGINLTNRPFSVFQITVKAGKVIHNTARKIDELYISIPHLQEEIRNDPPVILRENFDYYLEGGYLKFTPALFDTASPAPEELWAECVHIDNTPVIEANFGRLVELEHDDLVAKQTRAPYLAAVKGLWFAMTNGPTVANLRLGLQILMGLPFSEARGKILDITHNFSVDSYSQAIGRVLAEDVDDEGRGLGIRRFYYFPEAVGLELNPLTQVPFAVGDIVEAFLPLSKGVEVTDYVKNPTWWIHSLAGAEIRKFFLFRAQIDTESGVFDEKDLSFSLEFIRKIKPIYTDVLASVLRSLDDDVLTDFEDDFVDCKHTLRFYDDVGAFGAHESTVRSDDFNHQGVVLWRGNSRPFSTRSLHTIRNLTTVQSGAAVHASSASGLGSVRARVAGDASNPFIEGDLVVIHPGQPGSMLLAPKLYEITSVTLPNGPAVLGNEASMGEPTSLTLNAPVAASFSYGSNIVASIVRRAVNPVVRGSDLQTISGAIQIAQSATGAFKVNGVELDDHLIIESGANAGEYRIRSILTQTSPRDYTPAGVPQISATQVGLVTFAGDNPALSNLSSQVYRIIRPSMMRTRLENARIVQTAGNMHAHVRDSGTSFPFDAFTPGMVGTELLVQNAENVLNNGTYTILEYIDAGNVRITTGAPQTSDAAAQAVATIRSPYHPGFERADELAPTEVLAVTLDGVIWLASGSSSVVGTLTGIGALAGTAAGTSTASLTLHAALSGSAAGTCTVVGTLTGVGALAGTAAGSTVVSGALAQVAGTAAGSSTATGTLTGLGSLAGTAAGSSTASGTLAQLAGESLGSSMASGTLGQLAGSSAGTSNVTGTLTS